MGGEPNVPCLPGVQSGTINAGGATGSSVPVGCARGPTGRGVGSASDCRGRRLSGNVGGVMGRTGCTGESDVGFGCPAGAPRQSSAGDGGIGSAGTSIFTGGRYSGISRTVGDGTTGSRGAVDGTWLAAGSTGTMM